MWENFSKLLFCQDSGILPKAKEADQETKSKPKRGVGRPKGSKNKNKEDNVKLNVKSNVLMCERL